MSRHATRPRIQRWRPVAPALLAALLTLVLAATVVIVLDATPASVRRLAARAPVIGAQCPSPRLPSTTITLTVAPELETTVTQALAPMARTTLPQRECVQVSVQAQEPSETVQGAQILPVDRAPDVWIADSSLWVSRLAGWPVQPAGSFASSPVVIASSQAAVDQLGWSATAPTWFKALAGGRPIATPRIDEDAAGLSAVAALWQSLGKGDQAQQALAGTVLATGRAGIPTESQAIQAARSGSASAPLLPTSAQAVTAANATGTGAKLVAVRPTGGSPALDYPILVTRRTGSPARERALKAVLAQLTSSDSAARARAAGFQAGPSAAARSSSTIPPSTTSTSNTTSTTAATTPVVGLSAQELGGLVARITALTAPTRVLVIFDLSGSMIAPAGNGMTRIQFAGVAAKMAGDLLTDRAQTGLWGFSRDLKGTKDIIDLVGVKELGATEGNGTHREVMDKAMFSAPLQLGGNGTALYTAAVAGMKRMNELYDPRAGNAVVLFTDGANSDPGGPTMKATLAKLKQLYDPAKPVRLVCVGIGSGLDMHELKQLAGAAGGLAYPAKDPKALPKVLFDVMNRRGR